ncbi:MaoC family dehydratase N-terminal domain-containing protein [Haladaptatus sp. GCM10025707]|uniref:FAS1-like dehydratase domain-containing protein n=1 Tax=unclassified Haladaptatus TaxID=2622732 RepID=UPI0023E85D4A|nr:MaoC family dehydratase N-terminal domain-containing protein [Haladaptatus sp. QDMS2]
MSNRTFDRLKPRVGETVDSVEGLTVEAGKVAEFAGAIGDDNPIFRDAGGETRGFERIPAPLTFTRTSMFPRYRPEGSGRLGFDLGFDIRYELHGEQAYEFSRPVYVGDTLSGTTTLTDVYERDGAKGGTMTFAVLNTEYVDEDGTQVISERSTLIETASAIEGPNGASETDTHISNEGRARVRHPASEFKVDSVEDVAVGDAAPQIIVEGLTPVDFVRYAGASGDFNPIHYDAQYAKELGNPSVFGQGMLTAGYAGNVVADWFGLERIRRFSTRFTARVWLGDTLTVGGTVTSVDSSAVTAELTVTRQTGDVVLRGETTAEFSTHEP